MNFGDKLRILIEDKDMTQKELAAQLNISPSTILLHGELRCIGFGSHILLVTGDNSDILVVVSIVSLPSIIIPFFKKIASGNDGQTQIKNSLSDIEIFGAICYNYKLNVDKGDMR